MPDWTPEQLADQDRLCGCDHFKNTHAGGQGKCLFAQLQAVNGYPGAPECPCQAFVEDEAKTAAYRAQRDRQKAHKKGIRLERPNT